MEVRPDLTGYAHALGRTQAGWQFASSELRRSAALAMISAAWDSFRRDAGSGAVGPAHEATSAAAQLLFTEDPRRDAVLLWLAEQGAAPIAEAAGMITRMVGATRRFATEDLALVDAARDALARPGATSGPIARIVGRISCSGNPALESLSTLASAIDQLRDDVGFLEGDGAEVRHALPRGMLSRYVPAEPAGCWALNLALVGRGALPIGTLPPAGLVSRVLFRGDLEADEIAVHLIECASQACTGSYDRLLRLKSELDRGREALGHLSRNARTRDAWLPVVALGACTRTQLARALGLSHGGADIQAHALADAGLATLSAGGKIAWKRGGTAHDAAPPPIDQGPLGNAVLDLDASLTEIDRLLARTTG